VRVDVTVEMPGYREEVEDVYDDCMAFLNERFSKEVNDVRDFVVRSRERATKHKNPF